MDCKKAYSLIQDFVDGTIGAVDKGQLEHHVAMCPKCAAEIEAFKSLDALLSEVEFEEVPVGFADAVIDHLRSTGHIRQPSPAVARAPRVWTGLFGWLPARLNAPVAVAALLVIVLSVISITSGRFEGFVGKSTVFVTDAYLDAQQTLGSVGFICGIVEGVAKDIGTIKTIVSAGFSLLSTAGEALMLPAVLLVLALTIGLGWFVKAGRKRSTHNASYSF
jgi:hypothetical protein